MDVRRNQSSMDLTKRKDLSTPRDSRDGPLPCDCGRNLQLSPSLLWTSNCTRLTTSPTVVQEPRPTLSCTQKSVRANELKPNNIHFFTGKLQFPLRLHATYHQPEAWSQTMANTKSESSFRKPKKKTSRRTLASTITNRWRQLTISSSIVRIPRLVLRRTNRRKKSHVTNSAWSPSTKDRRKSFCNKKNSLKTHILLLILLYRIHTPRWNNFWHTANLCPLTKRGLCFKKQTQKSTIISFGL